MYRDPEAPLSDAYRVTGREVRAESRRQAFVEFRSRELLRLLTSRPLLAVVPSMYTQERGAVPVAADMAGWVAEVSMDADRTLAEAMFSPDARARLVYRYCDARAEAEASDKDGKGHFFEVEA